MVDHLLIRYFFFWSWALRLISDTLSLLSEIIQKNTLKRGRKKETSMQKKNRHERLGIMILQLFQLDRIMNIGIAHDFCLKLSPAIDGWPSRSDCRHSSKGRQGVGKVAPTYMSHCMHVFNFFLLLYMVAGCLAKLGVFGGHHPLQRDAFHHLCKFQNKDVLPGVAAIKCSTV